MWKWKGTRGLGEIAFDRISRLEKEPSLPQLSANEISRDTICLFESLFPACTRSRAYARIRCKRLVQRTTDLIGFRTRFANSSVYRFNGSFSSISGKALERWICPSKPFFDESIVSRRDSTHLVLSKDSSAGVRPSVGSRDRGYNLLPLMDGASLRTMRDRIAVGIALLKFNPPDGELISTRGRGVVLYIRLESDRVTRYYY